MFFVTCTVARRLSERFPFSPLGWHARRARWWYTDSCTSRLSCSPRTSRPSRSSLIPVPGVGLDRQGRSGWRALRCRPLSHPPPLGIEPCGRAAPCRWRPHHRLHLGSHPFVRRCCSLLRGPTAARTDARRLWLWTMYVVVWCSWACLNSKHRRSARCSQTLPAGRRHAPARTRRTSSPRTPTCRPGGRPTRA